MGSKRVGRDRATNTFTLNAKERAKVRALTGEEGVLEVWNENIGQTQMGLRRELPWRSSG